MLKLNLATSYTIRKTLRIYCYYESRLLLVNGYVCFILLRSINALLWSVRRKFRVHHKKKRSWIDLILKRQKTTVYKILWNSNEWKPVSGLIISLVVRYICINWIVEERSKLDCFLFFSSSFWDAYQRLLFFCSNESNILKLIHTFKWKKTKITINFYWNF